MDTSHQSERGSPSEIKLNWKETARGNKKDDVEKNPVKTEKLEKKGRFVSTCVRPNKARQLLLDTPGQQDKIIKKKKKARRVALKRAGNVPLS